MQPGKKPISIPQDVLGTLLMAIDGGRWKAGDRLPPERHLAEELGLAGPRSASRCPNSNGGAASAATWDRAPS
jgi:hypothetical protein